MTKDWISYLILTDLLTLYIFCYLTSVERDGIKKGLISAHKKTYPMILFRGMTKFSCTTSSSNNTTQLTQLYFCLYRKLMLFSCRFDVPDHSSLILWFHQVEWKVLSEPSSRMSLIHARDSLMSKWKKACHGIRSSHTFFSFFIPSNDGSSSRSKSVMLNGLTSAISRIVMRTEYLILLTRLLLVALLARINKWLFFNCQNFQMGWDEKSFRLSSQSARP